MNKFEFPLVHEFPYRDPCQIFSHFSQQEGAIFLDSAQERQHCGLYSFIALKPFQVLSSKNGVINLNGDLSQGNPFEILQAELNRFKQITLPHLPPFQGGAAGFLSYELAQHLEKLPMAAVDELEFPDLLMGFYDVVMGFDLKQKRAWIFSSGFPLQEPQTRLTRARLRLDELLGAITRLPRDDSELPLNDSPSQVTANFSPEAYQQQISRVIDYILAGDIFQANLTRRFRTEIDPDFQPFDLYRRLRKINPAPFAAYVYFENCILASASPERFIKLEAGKVETRPIKGTRPRGGSAEEDRRLVNELLASAKDRAENVMIVDLLRNDLSKVCEAHSVQVSQLCGLETYPSVHHLVSVVSGKLRENRQALDLLKATFPGGSITGAPKVRAMEIIAELEPTRRGPYCGSLAYLGFDGTMDSSIIIRTFCIRNKIVSFQAGGAIVADSDPRQEQEEVMTKARALFAALRSETYDPAY